MSPRWSNSSLKLYFMRHAHSVSQLDKSIVVGRAFHQPLSDLGNKQAKQLGDATTSLGITRIYSSTCVRAMETAEGVAQSIGIPVVLSETLIERSQGDFEGRRKDQVYTPDVVEQIHGDQLRWRPPGGESLEEVKSRLERFLKELNCMVEPGAVCLIVTHLMVLWALFSACTRCHHAIIPQLHVDNGALVEVEMGPDGDLRLMRWNLPLLRP